MTSRPVPRPCTMAMLSVTEVISTAGQPFTVTIAVSLSAAGAQPFVTRAQ